MTSPRPNPRATTPRARALDASPEPTRVLVVDDDELWPRVVRRSLGLTPHFVDCVTSGHAALRELDRLPYDAIVSDLVMPGMSGLELLQAVRSRDLRIPVILMTAAPTVESAAAAVEAGAFRYLVKPIASEALRRAIDDAVAAGRTVPGELRAPSEARQSARRHSEDAFSSALRTLQMAYQPIVSTETRRTIGVEALMRSQEPRLPNPLAVIDAAEKLGTTQLLGRRVRRLVADGIEQAPAELSFFVNVHANDLTDDDLYDPRAPLSRFARRVVLEITERASLDTVDDLPRRIGALRALGFRLAIDDLGAGYAGLTSFVQIQPEIVKLDMSLVRSVDQDVVRQRVIRSLASLAAGVGAEVVAEGVETAAERDTLTRLGCTYLQGYALGRPGPAFPEGRWS